MSCRNAHDELVDENSQFFFLFPHFGPSTANSLGFMLFIIQLVWSLISFPTVMLPTYLPALQDLLCPLLEIPSAALARSFYDS